MGTSPSAGAMDTGNSITYKYKQGSLSYLGRVMAIIMPISICFQFYSVAMLPLNLLHPIIGASSQVFPLGWVASEEEFMKSCCRHGFEYMKLRFSHGDVPGKDNNIKSMGMEANSIHWILVEDMDSVLTVVSCKTGIKPGRLQS